MTATEIARQPGRKFTHHMSDGCACALCGDTSRPLSFHVLQAAYSRDDAQPRGFLVMAMTVEAAQGVFPLCDRCAPSCAICGLPTVSGKVEKFRKSVKASNGPGVCPHGSGSIGERIGAIFKRTLKSWSRQQH